MKECSYATYKHDSTRRIQKVNEEPEDSRDKYLKKPFLQKMIIPSDLNDIQPRDTQIWNCDEIGFDTNVRCNKVICNYKLFQD